MDQWPVSQGSFREIQSRVFDCRQPVLAIFNNAIFASDIEAAAKLLKENPGRLILTGREKPNDKYAEFVNGTDYGHFEIKKFSSNELEVVVKQSGINPVWLFYGDAFDTLWNARVDDTAVEVYRAQIAYKAVKVPPGEHIVRFRFGSVIMYIAYDGVVIACVAFIFIMFRNTIHDKYHSAVLRERGLQELIK